MFCFNFKIQIFFDVVLFKFTAEKYTIKNVKNRRKSFFYVQVIIKHVKTIIIDGIFNQFIFVHENCRELLYDRWDVKAVDC